MTGMTVTDLWEFHLDSQRRYLRIVLRGFWTEEVLARYEPVLEGT